MINFEEATNRAKSYLQQMQNEIGIPLEITAYQEYSLGWVFCYQSKEYIETGEFTAMLAGNAPFLIDRNGNIRDLGTAYSIEKYLEEYAQEKN